MGVAFHPFVKDDPFMATVIASSAPVRKFKSPARILVRSFRMSRDNWKGKYQKLQQTAKRAQVRAYDACHSRDVWRERAEAAERELEQLRSQATPSVAPEIAPQKK